MKKLDTSIHQINLEHKNSKFKNWYYSFLFKITNGRSTTIFGLFPYWFRDFYYDKVSPLIFPNHKRLRKAIPYNWRDISTLITTVNFEFIKSFYEDEYLKGYVVWTATNKLKKFSKWLESAYHYITVERVDLEKQKDAAYPPFKPIEETFKPIKNEQGKVKHYELINDGKTYEEIYGEVDRLEELIYKKDTKILLEMIKNRDYFWT
jgi:hypothetical protein